MLKMRSQLKLFFTAVFLTFPTVAKALEVEISPSAPKQGDTISVVITDTTTDNAPTVTLDGKNYPAFPTTEGYRALVPTSPLDDSGKMTLQVSEGDETRNFGIWLQNRSFPTQRITLSGKASRPATKLELDRVAEFKNLVTPKKYWNGSFARPNGSRVSTVYGVRRYYNGVFANDYYHKGVDYAGGYGSPIVAPAAGKVVLIGKESEGFHVHGNVVGVDHGQGVARIFMHLQDINVKEGDTVKAGQRIGTVGSTGASTGPHLHWGLYLHGVAVDPVPCRFNSID